VATDGRDRDGELWRAFVAASPDHVIVLDPDGTIRSFNHLDGAYVSRIVPGANVLGPGFTGTELPRALREVLETRAAVRYEVQVPRADGSLGWYEVSVVPVVVDGKVDRVIWYGKDVSERRREEERLAFQAAILSQLNEAVLVVGDDHVVHHWNEAATRLFGWSGEEAVGKRSIDLLDPRYLNAGGYDAMAASVVGAGTWRGELAVATKSGDEVIVESSVRYLPELRKSIAVMKDMTARRQLEEQLRQSQKMEAVGLLAGGVAHDFNNLLAVILGFAELAAHKLPPDHPVAQDLTEVVAAARRGGELTRKLLAFSRKQILQPRPMDLREAVDDFTRMLGRLLGEDIELEVERAPDAAIVRADPVQLEQVLLNLCANARQAMPRGGRLRLSTRAVSFDAAFAARHPWARAGTFVELAVSDTGVGMDAATQSRLFEPFFSTKRDGTGLGLATVYGIVQQHGGFVRVESQPDAGTTFHVYLPAIEEPVPSPRASAPSRLHDTARGDESVLIVEDEPSLRALVVTTLSELGYHVIPTGDGEEAVRAYESRANDIALVVMDVVLPRLGGREAYERMRGIRPDVKVLFTTGYAPESTRLGELLEGGRMALLQKPFTAHALAAMVRSAIDA